MVCGCEALELVLTGLIWHMATKLVLHPEEHGRRKSPAEPCCLVPVV